jgi:hypothetical protein
LKFLSKKDAADVLGESKQWMHYRTKKKGGVYPEWVSECGTQVDIENQLLLGLSRKNKAKAKSNDLKAKNNPKYKETRGKKSKKSNKKVSKKAVSSSKSTNEPAKKGIVSNERKKIVSDEDIKEAELKQQDEAQAILEAKIAELEEEAKEPEDPEMKELFKEAEKAKCQTLIYKSQHAKDEMEENRERLIQREILESTIFPYLDNLSKNLFQNLEAYVPQLRATFEAGSNDIQIKNDLNKCASAALSISKKDIVKFLKSLKNVD